jgi:hypothetical protein
MNIGVRQRRMERRSPTVAGAAATRVVAALASHRLADGQRDTIVRAPTTSRDNAKRCLESMQFLVEGR